MFCPHIATNTEGEFLFAGVTLLEGLINQAILKQGRCILGLSGGSTPRPVYEGLGKSTEIDWSKTEIFLVDERHVPADAKDSNARLIQETLMASASIPSEQFIHPILAPLDAWQADYENMLTRLFDGGWPDVVTLGMGEDGHIASLFPPVPDEAFGPAVTLHTVTDRFSVRDRLSVTLPVLTHAGSTVLLLKGEEKRKVWEKMQTSNEDHRRWPAKAVIESGNTTLISMW